MLKHLITILHLTFGEHLLKHFFFKIDEKTYYKIKKILDRSDILSVLVIVVIDFYYYWVIILECNYTTLNI